MKKIKYWIAGFLLIVTIVAVFMFTANKEMMICACLPEMESKNGVVLVSLDSNIHSEVMETESRSNRFLLSANTNLDKGIIHQVEDKSRDTGIIVNQFDQKSEYIF